MPHYKCIKNEIHWFDTHEECLQFSKLDLTEITDLEADYIREAKRLADYAALTYAQLRAAEYPPQQDYIDAQVKKASTDAAIQAVGLAQEAAYFAACLAVKDKYPKGA